MSEQYLIPFKGKFILSVDTTMKNFFKNPDEVSLKEKFNMVADNIGNVDIGDFIKHYQLGFSLYKKYQHFHFKYHQAFEVNPSNLIDKDERDFQLSFKLESSEVEILQIIDNKITFANSTKQVHTFELNDHLQLIKTLDYTDPC